MERTLISPIQIGKKAKGSEINLLSPWRKYGDVSFATCVVDDIFFYRVVRKDLKFGFFCYYLVSRTEQSSKVTDFIENNSKFVSMDSWKSGTRRIVNGSNYYI